MIIKAEKITAAPQPALGQIVTGRQAARMIEAKCAELNGRIAAAALWGVSPQMIHLVIKGDRKPSDKMLDAIGLEPIRAEVKYRRVK